METPKSPPGTIRILRQFEPFLRILKAYDLNNFSHSSWRTMLSSICDAFYATLLNSATAILIVLIAWHLIENDADIDKLVVAMPILIGLLMGESIIVQLMSKTDIIIGIVERLQKVVDQR